MNKKFGVNPQARQKGRKPLHSLGLPQPDLKFVWARPNLGTDRNAIREIRSLADLNALEESIRIEIHSHPLDAVLLGLRTLRPYDPENGVGVPPHIVGTAARFATRYGKPGPMTEKALPIGNEELRRILQLSAEFAHADPVAWDSSVGNSTLSFMLRLAGNQFPYIPSWIGKWGRAQILYNELPTEIADSKHTPRFNFHERFKELTKATVGDFIDIGFMSFVAAKSVNQLGFTRGYFEKARTDGLTIADDDVVQSVLNNIAADSTTHAQISVKYQQPQRDFAAYDFNSLMVYPLIRPWPTENGEQMEFDRMIAPIPDLILYRITSGIYYQMHYHWKDEFDQYFGHLLSAYVGRVLRGFVTTGNLISEDEIRKTYPSNMGKVPDWVIVDGKTAILIEVKVARIHRIVYVTGDEEKLRENLDAVQKGLEQIFDFQSAVARHAPGLQQFARCKEFIPIIITFEPTYLSESSPFKELVRSGLPQEAKQMKWSLLSLDAIEWIQLHLSNDAIDIASVFRYALASDINGVIDSISSLSERSYPDSLLAKKEEELYDRLSVPRI